MLSGRVLITGATGGIGHAIARAFAARGAQLVLTGRRATVLEPLASELGAEAIACDLSRHEDTDRLVSQAGDIDVLVANAAMPGTGHVLELRTEQVDRMLEVNLRAPIVLGHAMASAMAKRGGGHIVFISSLNGIAATPLTAMYCAAKFGLRGFALAAREDLRDSGVGVSVVYPGFISGAGMFADSGVRLPPYLRTRSPEQVADGVLKAVEDDRAEVMVAPGLLRASSVFAGVLPAAAAAISRRLGGDRLAAEIAAGQSGRRN